MATDTPLGQDGPQVLHLVPSTSRFRRASVARTIRTAFPLWPRAYVPAADAALGLAINIVGIAVFVLHVTENTQHGLGCRVHVDLAFDVVVLAAHGRRRQSIDLRL
jgi:hypothetical protein